MKRLIDYREDLEAAFGTRELTISLKDDYRAEIETDLVRASIGYDPRDRLLGASIAPLNMPDGLDEELDVFTLLHMLGFMDDDEPLAPRHAEDLRDYVRIVGIVMKEIFLRGPERIRDAHFFHAGYCAGYTDQMNDGAERNATASSAP